MTKMFEDFLTMTDEQALEILEYFVKSPKLFTAEEFLVLSAILEWD